MCFLNHPSLFSVAASAVQQPAIQVAAPRNQAARPSLNDYQHKSQTLALSFKSNPQYTSVEPTSLEHNNYKSQNTQPQLASAYNSNDQYTRLASNNDHYEAQKPQHDLLQTFYPDTLHPRFYAPPTVAVGKPLFIYPSHAKPQPFKSTQNSPNKVSLLLKNAMNNFAKVPVNKPSIMNTLIAAQTKPQIGSKPAIIGNKPAIRPATLDGKSSQEENMDDAHADMRDPDKDADDNTSESIDQTPAPEPGIDDQATDQATNIPKVNPPGQRPGDELRPIKTDSNRLNGFRKPVQVSITKGNPTFVKRPQITKGQVAPAFDNINLRQPSINFDDLKDKIMHSTNATFLRRMLTLIQKITHHKDYQKLQGPARSFVAQANTAVQALNKAYNERISSSPVSMETGNQIYVNDYGLRKKSAVQTPNTVYNARVAPGNLETGNLYGNNYALRKKTAVQTLNRAYNGGVAISPVNRPGTGNQLYGNDYRLAKKFLIASNPYYPRYYQYRQPYSSNIQSMRYGLYNGNIP